MRILITSPSWKSSIACMHSWGKDGHTISIISSDKYAAPLYSKFCSEKIISPEEKNEKEYLPFLLRLIKEKKYDLFVPISDQVNEYASENREELLKYTKLLMPPKDSFDIARNKIKTYQFALENEIPIPETYFPKTLSDLQHAAEKISFPCVIKKNIGTGGSGNTYVNNQKDIIHFFDNFKKTNEPWPVIQKFINGRFCGFTAVCYEGRILNYFTFEVLRQYPASGGTTVYARSYQNDSLLDMSTKLIQKLNWTGAIDLDIFIDKTDNIFLIEINPRFSGTMPFAYLCGVDLPETYLGLITKNKPKTQPVKYKNRTYYRAVLLEEFLSCLEKPKYFLSFFFNFLNPIYTSDLSLSDLRMLYRQMVSVKWVISRKLNLGNGNIFCRTRKKNVHN